MYKKIIIQLLLLVTLFGIIIIVYLLYFNDQEKLVKPVLTPNEIPTLTPNEIPTLTPNEIVESKIDNETGTLISDLSYSFSDLSGNYYELFSDHGKIDIYSSEKILMTNVNAKIHLKNSSPITINSKFAYYNKANHETNFFENVVLSHLAHEATSENLDISFDDNLASMYNNMIYKKPGTQLNADRLEIDLITKKTKIFMDKKSKKIKIVDNK